MAKDPAALIYIDTWLSSTADMDADCRGWYLNLVLHQYDKGSLPNDIERLAQLASVRFSEFDRFKQVFEQVLKQKFGLCDDGRLRNAKADNIIQGRQKFTDKRSKSGSVGVIVKLAASLGFKKKEIDRLKNDLYSNQLDIEQAKNKQLLEQMLKLYRNEDVNKSKDELVYKSENFKKAWKAWTDYKLSQHKFKYKSIKNEQIALNELQRFDYEFARELIKTAISNGWKGFIFDATKSAYDTWKSRPVSTEQSKKIDIAILEHLRDVQLKDNNPDNSENNRMRGLSEG